MCDSSETDRPANHMSKPRVLAKALVLFRRADLILVNESRDSVKNETFSVHSAAASNSASAARTRPGAR
jgi:hypothetical protein